MKRSQARVSDDRFAPHPAAASARSPLSVTPEPSTAMTVCRKKRGRKKGADTARSRQHTHNEDTATSGARRSPPQPAQTTPRPLHPFPGLHFDSKRAKEEKKDTRKEKKRLLSVSVTKSTPQPAAASARNPSSVTPPCRPVLDRRKATVTAAGQKRNRRRKKTTLKSQRGQPGATSSLRQHAQALVCHASLQACV